MKIWILFSLVIILTQVAFSLSVDLSLPVENAVYVDSNTVVFKCRASGTDLRFLELWSNINGWGKKAEFQNPQNNTDISFSVKNISNGNYLWNCKAIDGLEGITYGPQNKTFSVNLAPNNPPALNNNLPHQTWNMNSQRNNAFDLDNYFSDSDNDQLTYSVSGNANINVNIDSNNQVSFSQQSNWFGTEKIYFTARDKESATNSNYLNLTVLKTESPTPNPSPSTNTPPTIERRIPDQNKSVDIISWYLDLSGYAKDTEDSESKLNWTISGLSNDIIKAEIDNSNKRIKFSPIGKSGLDTISLIVSDSLGLNTSQSIKIYIYSNNAEITNTFEELEENKQTDSELKISSHSPIDNEVTLEKNKLLVFSIETNIQSDIEWYLDNKLTQETTKSFDFNSNEESLHNLTVYVSDLDKLVSFTWLINIEKEQESIIVQNNNPVCGNNLIESSETCSNCPNDVKCSENQICENETCIGKKDFLSITGNFVKNIKPLENKNILIIVSIIVLLLIFLKIISVRRKNKTKYSSNLKEFEEKQGFIKKFQKNLRAWYFTRKQKKLNNLNLRKLESEKRVEISNSAPSIISISEFIKENITKGHSRSDIKTALKQKGWSRIQIWRAFKNLKS